MVSALRALILVLCVLVFAAPVCAQEIPNWPAPATWSPHSASRGVLTMDAVTSPLPFIGLAPCRIVDTRGNGAPIQGGMFTGGSDVRNYAVAGICWIPDVAQALSLNFTVTGPGQTTAGFLLAWPTGGAVPPASILNWDHVPAQIANAAIVPAGSGPFVSITVNVSAPTHVIIDVNGYYAPAGIGTFNTFLGRNAGNFTMAGDYNTGLGYNALFSNTYGGANTAIGFEALLSNTTGGGNTATGHHALGQNDTGALNIAYGYQVLISNTTGASNTAIGSYALASNNGGLNTAIGFQALLNNTTGNSNIGIGHNAGINLETGNENICIGNPGVASDSGTIRVGSGQTKTFVAGVHGATSGGIGIPVLIDSNGQLGTVSSSARLKDEIQDMGEATEKLLRLRPVTFRYKAQPEGRTEFGLIAEEVEKVMPELVVCSSSGEAETVLYHEMPAMLLNELQKQQREIEELKSELSALRASVGQK